MFKWYIKVVPFLANVICGAYYLWWKLSGVFSSNQDINCAMRFYNLRTLVRWRLVGVNPEVIATINTMSTYFETRRRPFLPDQGLTFDEIQDCFFDNEIIALKYHSMLRDSVGLLTAYKELISKQPSAEAGMKSVIMNRAYLGLNRNETTELLRKVLLGE